MKYFSKNKKWVAYLMLLTFLFSCVIPTNFFEGNNVVWAEESIAPLPYGSGQFVLDKEATALNTNNQTDVTLSVGGGALESVDVVFILGGGMQANKETVDAAINVFKPIIESGDADKNVKLGILSLEKGQEIILDLADKEAVLHKDTYEQLIKDKFDYIDTLPGGTTNLHSQLLEAKKMLAADTDVKAENKYLFLLSTGRSYWFDNKDGEQTTIVGEVKQSAGSTGKGAGIFYYYGAYHWRALRGLNSNIYMIPATYGNSYAAFLDDITEWVTEDGDNYAYTPDLDPMDAGSYAAWLAKNGSDWRDLYNGGTGNRYGAVIVNPKPTKDNFTTGVVDGITYGSSPENAMNYERAQYECIQVYKQLVDAGYNCYAVCSEEPNYQNGSPNIKSKGYTGSSTIQVGHAFMDYLAQMGGQDYAPVVFDYERDENGDIVFYNGKTGNYNYTMPVLKENFFAPIEADLVQYLSAGSTVVDYIGYEEGEEGYNFDFVPDSFQLQVGDVVYGSERAETTEGATVSYLLGNGDTVDYYRGDGKKGEYFIWNIKNDVLSNAPAHLTYTLELVEKCEKPGVHYADTNQEATLYPVDSEGKEGTPELFPVPSVTYCVNNEPCHMGTITVAKATTGDAPEGPFTFKLFVKEEKTSPYAPLVTEAEDKLSDAIDANITTSTVATTSSAYTLEGTTLSQYIFAVNGEATMAVTSGSAMAYNPAIPFSATTSPADAELLAALKAALAKVYTSLQDLMEGLLAESITEDTVIIDQNALESILDAGDAYQELVASDERWHKENPAGSDLSIKMNEVTTTAGAMNYDAEDGWWIYEFEVAAGSAVAIDIESTTGSVISYTITEIVSPTPDNTKIYTYNPETGESLSLIKEGLSLMDSERRELIPLNDNNYGDSYLFQNNYKSEGNSMISPTDPYVPPYVSPDVSPNEPSNNPPEETLIEELPVPIGGVDAPEDPLVDLEDPETPLGDMEIPLGDAPATGDTTKAVTYVAMMLFALAGLVITRRKSN